MTQSKLKFLVACGLAGAAASVATAQPYLINGTGATLFQNFLRSPAATNDFIDADGDCLLAYDGDQLAPFDSGFPWRDDQHWQVTYRVVGSVNGFAELRDWGFTYLSGVDNDGNVDQGTFRSDFSDESLWNRAPFVNAGVPNGNGYNANNPGGSPVRSLKDGSYLVTTDTSDAAGIQTDFAVIDVPISWAVRQEVPNEERFNRVPTASGYGSNPRPILNADGTEVVTEDSRLPSLVGVNGPINTNYASPDEFTAFDTLIANVPVSAPVNYGVGMQQIKMSDLRHLNATGRRITGENLMVVTRDVGSGTRNAFMNGIGLDPSWGVGENIGARTVSSANDRLGPDFQPSNKGGSSRVDATVINHRLAVGHTGAERGVNNGWLGVRADMLAIQADIKGGSVYARPNLEAVLNGGVDGYNITGPGVIATIGDPRSAAPELGGYGALEPFRDYGLDGNEGTNDSGEGNCQYDAGEPFIDINGNGVRDAIEPRPDTLNPAMRNAQGAAWVNNVTRAVQGFSEAPGADENLFTPGEFLALNYVLVAAAEYIPQNPPPQEAEFIPLVVNPEFNGALNDFIEFESGNTLDDPRYYSYTDIPGVAPTRTTGVAYSDAAAPNGSPDGQRYVDQAGTSVAYGSTLHVRNKIAGDFNNDGLRDLNDAAEMIGAWRDRNGGPAWQAGTPAVIEVLGDFDGDGSFTARDVRYWADGLAIDANTGLLDRRAGFEAVDTAFGGNFFGTTIVNGRVYQTGDSRADVAGNLPTRGFVPNGADGVIDHADLAYVKAQFTNNPFVTDGEANWDDTAEAVGFDLSADITGDLKVNNDDVLAVQRIICVADFSGDGSVNTQDVLAFLNAWNSGLDSADVNLDGSVNTQDVLAFLNLWNTGC
ncbi:MAG: GC-type dockerin domain-anchored protein [Phycisphaerales bacterium JB054]